MLELIIRKVVTRVEEIHREMGPKVDPPARKATAAAVLQNPYAGEYVAADSMRHVQSRERLVVEEHDVTQKTV